MRDSSKRGFPLLEQNPYQCFKVMILTSPVRQSDGGILFGIGETTYLLFKVDTIDFKWSVRRRYSDFQWLRSNLNRLFPQFIIPPLPKKNKSKKSRDDLDRRMRILEFFLNDIAACSQLFRQPMVRSFLSEQDREKFQKLIKQVNDKLTPKFLHQYQMEDGKALIRVDEKTKITIDHLNTFLSIAESKYKDNTQKSKKLHHLFREAQDTLYGMGQNMTQLLQAYAMFNQRFGQDSQKRLRDLFISLQNLSVECANSLGQMVQDIAMNCTAFYKYMRHQTYSFKQLLLKTQKLQDQYLNHRKTLNRKKEKLWGTGDPARMDILLNDMKDVTKEDLKKKQKIIPLICGREQKQIQLKRKDYAFYSNVLYNQTKRVIGLGIKRFCSNFDSFSIKCKCQTQKLSQIFTQSYGWFLQDMKGAAQIKSRKIVIKQDIQDD